MNTILDHVADTNGAELARLAKLHTIPDFVKKADFNATRNPGPLPESAYADPRLKAYPCNSPESTYLSAMFFLDKKAEYHPKHAERVQGRLNAMVNFWGIKAAVDKLAEEHKEIYKSANDQLPDSSYAFVWVADNGVKERHLRMSNAIETKVAAAWLHKHRDELNFNDRRTVATKILEKAASYGASLGEHDMYIERQAGRGVCNPPEVVDMLRGRAKLAGQEKVAAEINKLADLVANKPQFSLDPNNLVKLAETVDTIDQTLRLAGKYTASIPRPEDVIFKATFKEASASVGNACSMTSGTVYDRGDFSKLDLSTVKAAFGDAFANEVQSGLGVDPEKMASIAATLPRPDAELFDSIASEAGIRPLPIKSAASEAIEVEKMAAWAGQY